MIDIKDMKKGICNLQLNSISNVDEDPSLLKLTFSILDFEVSGNKQIVSKELALEAAPTLALKPLLCVYTPTTDYEVKNDHFGSHGERLGTDRDGNEVIVSDAIAVGTAKDGGYLSNVTDENGNEKEILTCEFYLWQWRYSDICALILEMYEQGLPLYSSCEFYFKNYEMQDGVQILKSPLLFDGHAILQSGENNTGVIEPAYDSSKLLSINERWNKAISQALHCSNSENKLNKKLNNQNQQHIENVDENKIKQNNDKEDINNMADKTEMFKKVCELSYGDIKSKIYTELSKVLTGEEYVNCWISNYGVFDTYFIYETYLESEGGYVTYKVNYTKNADDTITVDMNSKAKMEYGYVEVATTTELETSLNSLKEENTNLTIKVNDLTTQLNVKDTENQTLITDKNSLTEQLNTANDTIKSVNEQLDGVKSEKDTLGKQFNDATEKLTSLNAKVEELNEIANKYNSEQYEKALNEKTLYYEGKFKAVNSVEKFNSDEVKELIKKSLNNNDEGEKAKLSLNSMLVDLVQPIEKDEKPMIKEFSSKHSNLIPTGSDFESKYSL